jgi:hypothetical protein
MPQLTPSQARVVNPVLTSIAQGIAQNDLIGNWLFPAVDVPMRGGQVLTFIRESFMRFGNFLKHLLGLLVANVFVGMVLE